MKFKTVLFTIITCLTFTISNAQNNRIYVDVSAIGNNNGMSWSNAYVDLQDAINMATINDTIWVASGTYIPNQFPTGAATSDNRKKCFYLDKNLSIYGGFNGTETTLTQRDFINNVTTLNGDFNGNDVFLNSGNNIIIVNNSENAYHLMITKNLDSTAIISGFEFINANADGFISNTNFNGSSYFNNHGGGFFNINSALKIENIVFKHMNANRGSGIYNTSSATKISNCTFLESISTWFGGAYFEEFSISNLNNCLFQDNQGSAISINSNSNSVLNNIICLRNISSSYGGGINLNLSTVTIANSTFDGNHATYGGGIDAVNSTATIRNSFFLNNIVTFKGGGVRANQSNLTMVNCVLSNNRAADEGGGTVLTNNTQTSIINCTYNGNYAPDGNNLYTDNSPGDVYNSIFWGSTVNNIENIGTWLTFYNSVVQGSDNPFFSWFNVGADGGGNISDNPLFVDPMNHNFNIYSNSPVINAGNNSVNTSTVDINGNNRTQGIIDIGAYEGGMMLNPSVIYVNATATGNNDGTNWINAYTNLQTALNNALAQDTIWIAQSTYLPSNYINPLDTGDARERSFFLNKDIVLLGGFNGTELSASQRNPTQNPTIISGDFNNDDIVTWNNNQLTFTNNFENSLHVFITANLDDLSIFDGLTFKGGNAPPNTTAPSFHNAYELDKNDGSGLVTLGSNLKVQDCIFENNRANSGAGLYTLHGEPTITDCTFFQNKVSGQGGGAYLSRSASTLVNCTFDRNTTGFKGGAIYLVSGETKMQNCTFNENKALSTGSYGGAIYVFVNKVSIESCEFSKNEGDNGGAISAAQQGRLLVTNSLFYQNEGNQGSCIYAQNSWDTLVNCTFYDNEITSTALYNSSSQLEIFNNIFWDSTNLPITNIGFANTNLGHNIIRNSGGSANWNTSLGTDAGNNLNVNPLFNNATTGDFTLNSNSLAINAGLNNYNNSVYDLGGSPRIQGGIIDLGVYESSGVVFANIETVICQGDTLFLAGNIYTNGIINDTIIVSNDSIIILDLNYITIDTTSISNTTCYGSFYPFNGMNLSQSGIYYNTLTNSYGCDSIIQLTLNITSSATIDTTTILDGICDGSTYFFNDIYISQPGNYYDTLTNIHGCDSLIDLTLIDIPPIEIMDTIINDVTNNSLGNIFITLADSTGYQYIWNTGATTQDITNVPAGYYILVITDTFSCVNVFSFQVSSSVSTDENFSDNYNTINVFPNPIKANENITIVATLNQSENIQIQITNMLGQIIANSKYTLQKGENRIQVQAPNQSGVYFFNFIDNKGNHSKKRILVN